MNPSKRFSDLDFHGFSRLAKTPGLSKYERIGFPDDYRKGFEQKIFADIKAKLPGLSEPRTLAIDIGPGCSDLPRHVIRHVLQRRGKVVLVDSQEMLAHLPEDAAITKIALPFPLCIPPLQRFKGRAGTVLSYSVLQYITKEASAFAFIDLCMTLLAPGGRVLLGDIPNVSKRKRFLRSDAGMKFHRTFTSSRTAPRVVFDKIEHGQIDDSLVLGLLLRARTAGFDAYVLPQSSALPMANRREDILIVRP